MKKLLVLSLLCSVSMVSAVHRQLNCGDPDAFCVSEVVSFVIVSVTYDDVAEQQEMMCGLQKSLDEIENGICCEKTLRAHLELDLAKYTQAIQTPYGWDRQGLLGEGFDKFWKETEHSISEENLKQLKKKWLDMQKCIEVTDKYLEGWLLSALQLISKP